MVVQHIIFSEWLINMISESQSDVTETIYNIQQSLKYIFVHVCYLYLLLPT